MIKVDHWTGRWRCPACGHWVDKHAGWRVSIIGVDGGASPDNEELCERCYHHFHALILKDGRVYDPP